MKAYSYIRFSSPEQLKGDSLRRQIELSEKYAVDHGLELDTALNLKDLGVSAFTGEHLRHGALGGFLKLVEMNKIEKGSVLLVESFDRLSREEITEALEQFLAIIRKKIKIVTLLDGREYTKETINANIGELIVSITIMARAHEESATKAKRLSAAWEKKRSQTIVKLTAKAPAWLKLSEDRTKFLRITDRVKAIRLIFDLKLSGVGKTAIVKKLNRLQHGWKPGSGWRESYIEKILRTPAVIGEFQPCQTIDGTREPIGENIIDYFPAVVDKDIFYRVQEQFSQNKGKGGRTGKVSNLFSHIAKCGYCGGAMHYVNKGQPPKGYGYLVCDNAKRKNGDCKSKGWRYDQFEDDIILFMGSEIDVKQLLPDHEIIESEISNLQTEQLSIQGQLNKIEFEITNLSNSIATTPDQRIREILEKSLSGRLDEKEKLQEKVKTIETERNNLKQISNNVEERINDMRELMTHMRKAEPNDQIQIRLKLREAIRAVIKRIDIFASGFKDRKHVNEEVDSKQERQIFYEGIDNSDFKFYQVDFKFNEGHSLTVARYPEPVGRKLMILDRWNEIKGGGFYQEIGKKVINEFIKEQEKEGLFPKGTFKKS